MVSDVKRGLQWYSELNYFGLLEKETMEYLLNNKNIPYVRGQVKVRKEGNPMRIIVSMRDTMCSNLAKYLTKITKSLAGGVRCIKNTQEFIKQLYKSKIKKNYSLASLDVSDMFTSIDRNKMLKTLDKMLDLNEDWTREMPLSKESLIRLFEFCIENVIFQFRDKIYYQLNGLPMGLPISPFLADISVNEFLAKYWDFQKYPYSGLAGYVDDIFVVSELSENQIKSLVYEFNKLDENLKFEYEYEKSNSISFLDVQIHFNGTKLCLETNWFKKPTASNRLLHYESDHNRAMKKNIAINMIKRIQIANNGNHNDNDMQILVNILVNSGYPHDLVKKIFRMVRKQNNEDRRMVENGQNSKQSVIVIPHVNELTEKLRHCLKKFGVKIYTKLNPSIGDMVNKGKIVALNNINKNKTIEEKCIKTGEFAVYGLLCECGDLYTGETVSLYKRIKQHKMKIKKFDIDNSELVQHISANTDCAIKFDESVIFDNESNLFRRKKFESVYSTTNLSYNKRQKISPQWISMIKQWIKPRSGKIFLSY
ncbi:unnamed protein product [Didymodactylos carnosus]|uniref:Reverse transcriptase domain-containing protein n=2 Tax=Didymodactylos carnosus TaxID=1234261 RepID=A0A814VSP4_9BILA|nr:unnamed protein product [Didymodactylos carnosus]CAF3958907.1 unnamed protein product [Didymodactylos carnosus]